MNCLRVSAIGSTVALVAALVGVPSAPALADADADAKLEPVCDIAVEAPHNSRGAGGIIAKARLFCDPGRTITYDSLRFTLFSGCDDPLPAKKPFTRFDCDEITSENISQRSVASGQTLTEYVPGLGESGHDNVPGYHRAYIVYNYPGSQTEYQRASIQRSGVL